ncbi:MAG TPA: Maf family protein, partial [Blastocatellia bacterium]|nr:Maf family protein [Blastocatellia bacterium]
MVERKPRIILASASPRRAQLLTQIGVEFEVTPGNVTEMPHPDEAPPDYITRISRAKVIAAAHQHDSGLVLGADTVVVLDGH